MSDVNHGLLLGAHMSISGGVHKSPARGAQVQSTALQIFTKSSRRWVDAPLSSDCINCYPRALDEAGIHPQNVVAHTSYLINLASPNDEVEQKSIVALEDELQRCEQLGVKFLVMHPGAHLGAGREAAIEKISRLVRDIYRRNASFTTRLLFEVTAGTGTNIGNKFEDIRDLLEACDLPAHAGVCMDTCHIFAAGYDIRTRETYDASMNEFDRIVGFKNLFAVHMNDSKHGLGSRKDRHEHIGQGLIGRDAFGFLVNDPRFRRIPLLLETDKGDDLAEDRMNLELLRSLVEAEAPTRPKKSAKAAGGSR